MFGTTPSFLEKLGLDQIDELPALGDFVPGADVVEQLERGLRPDARPAPDMADLDALPSLDEGGDGERAGGE
jgi:segregation and condensation protein B